MKKGLIGKIKLVVMVEVAPDIAYPTILNAERTVKVVEEIKNRILYSLKEKITELKIEDIEFEEVNIPELEE